MEKVSTIILMFSSRGKHKTRCVNCSYSDNVPKETLGRLGVGGGGTGED